ncbi:MAG: BACON domain-containing protein [Bacteroidales bacterium]|nr:BACON domain-containing protein [Bacteroidales bacterium]
MKKTLKFFLLIAAFASVLQGCKPQPSMTLGSESITAPAAGLTQAVNISTNYPWSATASDAWIVLHNTEALSGDAVIGVYVMANTTYADREGTITVTCEDLVKTIKVTQSQNDALSVDGNAASITYVGGELIIPVEANVRYEVVIPAEASWITDGGTRSLTAYQHAVTLARNESEEDRDAEIIFRNAESGLEKTFYIKQQGFSPTVVIEHSCAEFTVPTLTGEKAVGTVMWGDGTSDEYEKGLVHTYPEAGNWTVTIIGKGITGYKLVSLEGVSSMDLTEF